MKFLNWFLSIIILTMCLLPCADGYAQDFSGAQISSVIKSTTAEKNAVADYCSPFCLCSCCSTPTLTKHVVNTGAIVPLLLVEYAEFPFNNVSTPHISIWQPPKLG
ncbi:DUF6660 family protein [Pedobacter sp. AW1-32]|uniref:DUF6660 family protein n=1 Tax=Pedobacter sp. AW1-32 TaxID=3383026 RepID=UPI003FEEC66B